MFVKDAMTTRPFCCTPTCTAQLAAIIMQTAETDILPIVEKFSKKVVGVVTDHDLCLAIVAQGREPNQVPVSDCMTPTAHLLPAGG